MKDCSIEDIMILGSLVEALFGIGLGMFNSSTARAALESREREAIERGFATYVDGEFAWKEKP